jgi:hypothetical protein
MISLEGLRLSILIVRLILYERKQNLTCSEIVVFYNHIRRHESLGYVSPEVVERNNIFRQNKSA